MSTPKQVEYNLDFPNYKDPEDLAKCGWKLEGLNVVGIDTGTLFLTLTPEELAGYPEPSKEPK